MHVAFWALHEPARTPWARIAEMNCSRLLFGNVVFALSFVDIGVMSQLNLSPRNVINSGVREKCGYLSFPEVCLFVCPCLSVLVSVLSCVFVSVCVYCVVVRLCLPKWLPTSSCIFDQCAFLSAFLPHSILTCLCNFFVLTVSVVESPHIGEKSACSARTGRTRSSTISK